MVIVEKAERSDIPDIDKNKEKTKWCFSDSIKVYGQHSNRCFIIFYKNERYFMEMEVIVEKDERSDIPDIDKKKLFALMWLQRSFVGLQCSNNYDWTGYLIFWKVFSAFNRKFKFMGVKHCYAYAIQSWWEKQRF